MTKRTTSAEPLALAPERRSGEKPSRTDPVGVYRGVDVDGFGRLTAWALGVASLVVLYVVSMDVSAVGALLVLVLLPLIAVLVLWRRWARHRSEGTVKQGRKGIVVKGGRAGDAIFPYEAGLEWRDGGRIWTAQRSLLRITARTGLDHVLAFPGAAEARAFVQQLLKRYPPAAWVHLPADRTEPSVWFLALVALALFGVAPRVLQPGMYYPTAALTVPLVIVYTVIGHLVRGAEVRIGRDGVVKNTSTIPFLGTPRTLFLPWSRIGTIEVNTSAFGKDTGLDLTLRDGRSHRIRFSRTLSWVEAAELRRRLAELRPAPGVGVTEAHPLGWRAGESAEVWLERVEASLPGVTDYRHVTAERDDLLVIAGDKTLPWSARLAALIRLDRAGEEGIRALSAQISREYATLPVRTAFALADARDGTVLSCCKRAEAIDGLAADLASRA